MPCLPPFCPSVRRYLHSLFKWSGQKGPAPSESDSVSVKAVSPTTDHKFGSPNPEDSELYNNGSANVSSSRSLVCSFCWDSGLFAPGPFQEAWGALISYTGFSYHTTWSQVKLSAEGGCHWCKLLLATRIENVPGEALQVTAGFRPSSADHKANPKGVQTLRLMLNESPHSVYYVSTTSDDAAAPHIIARPRTLQVNSPSARSMASDCIMDCIRTHERCPPPHNTALPTRVIDCSDPAHPRLLCPDGEKASYLALSYVRGTTSPGYHTTTKNIETRLQGLDPSILPQTIRDAIETTQGFGVRYLWVDALCILQDSEEDKARETAQLPAIFGNAYFTIVAASARDVDAGFLQDRAPPSPPDVLLPFRCPDGQVGTMSLSPVWRQYDGSGEPVNERAWCFEERLLSARSLVYASHTLQYHCRHSVFNVGNAVCGPMIGQRLPDLLFRAAADPGASAVALSPKDTRTLRWAWVEAVGEYTQRALTELGDKLIAFAAIAELFHRAWRVDYLAGLWRSTLLQDLLWYTNPSTRCTRPAQYRAPSWSWAAVDGRILASSTDDRLDPDAKDTQTCAVVSCDVTPVTPVLPFGAVASGTLVLRGVMVEAVWNPGSPTPDLYAQPDSDAYAPGAFGEGEEDSPVEPPYIGCAYPDSSAEADVDEVWAVPLLWNRASQHTAGLIVARADGGADGRAEGSAPEERYRRVGFFHSPEDASGGLAWMSDGKERDIVLI